VELKNSRNLKFGIQIGSLYDQSFWGVKDHSAFFNPKVLTPQMFWDRALDTIAGFGFRGFEMTFGPGSYRSALERYGSAKAFGEACAAKGLQVSGGFYTGFVIGRTGLDLQASWRTKERRQEILREAEEYADFLCDAGSQLMVTGVPFRSTWNAEPPRFTDTGYLSALADFYTEIGYVTAKRGVRLALHCETNGVFWLRRDIDLLLLLTDPVYVDFCPDTAHIRTGGSDPSEVVRKHSSRLVAAHWKDCKKEMERGFLIDEKVFVAHVPYFTTVGRGLVDWMSWVRFLREVNFKDWAILEVTPSPGLETIKSAKAYVETSLLPIYS